MPNKEGSLNKAFSSSLSISSSEVLYINIHDSQRILINSINWGYSHLVTPIPAGDFTYGALKIIRSEQFKQAILYPDAFGSGAGALDMLFQDVIVGPNPNSHFLNFNQTMGKPLAIEPGVSALIVVSAPISNTLANIGAHLSVQAGYEEALLPRGEQVSVPRPRTLGENLR